MPRYDTEIISELYRRRVKGTSVVVEQRDPDIRTHVTDIDLTNGDQINVTVTFEAQWFEAHWEEWAQRRILVEPAHWEATIKSIIVTPGVADPNDPTDPQNKYPAGQPLDSELVGSEAYRGLETELHELLNHN
jgi:hypothetical protein